MEKKTDKIRFTGNKVFDKSRVQQQGIAPASHDADSSKNETYAGVLNEPWKDPERGWATFSGKFSAELIRHGRSGSTSRDAGRQTVDGALRESINHAARHQLSAVDAAQSIVRGVVVSAPSLGREALGLIQYATKRAVQLAIQAGEEPALVLDVTIQLIRQNNKLSNAERRSQYLAGIQGAKDACRDLNTSQADAVRTWIGEQASA